MGDLAAVLQRRLPDGRAFACRKAPTTLGSNDVSVQALAATAGSAIDSPMRAMALRAVSYRGSRRSPAETWRWRV